MAKACTQGMFNTCLGEGVLGGCNGCGTMCMAEAWHASRHTRTHGPASSAATNRRQGVAVPALACRSLAAAAAGAGDQVNLGLPVGCVPLDALHIEGG